MNRAPARRRFARAACRAVVLALAATAVLAQDGAPAYTANDDGPSRPPVASRDARRAAVERLLADRGAVAGTALAVAAFPLLPVPSGPSRVVLAIEVGRRQILPDSLAIGIRVLDARGGVAFNGSDETTVAPATPDAASPLLYTVEIPLAAGRYTARVAVVDGAGRPAAVDHPVVVEQAPSSDETRAGALMIGAAPLGGALRPLARSDIVRAGAVAWIEVAGAPRPGGRLEVLDDGGAILAGGTLTFDEPGAAGARVARAALPVLLLPPGRYTARLALDLPHAPMVRTRPFTLGRLPTPDPSAVGEFVSAAVGPFAPADVLAAPVLAPVLERALDLDPASRDDAMRAAVARLRAQGIGAVDARRFAARKDLAAHMLRGASLLHAGALEDAAHAFRAALRTASEFLPAIVYLGACYAAGGRDREAVGAWQTALVTEAGSPLVFRLAADGLVRLGDAAQALALLAEAAERWPDDTSLVRRHALAVASREGPGRAADALLQALQQASAPDADLVSLASRLAVFSAARDDDGAPARVARAKAVAVRAGTVPPLLEAWARYLRGRDGVKGLQ